jgi:glycosyltransferase involved in cell wall biosynthesis
MRSVHVLPGSGDRFYCENCVRDNGLVRALVDAGEDVVAVPMYLPQIVDPVPVVAASPVFFGGINAYLQQNSGFFRRTPRWLDRLFDWKPLLRLAAKRAGSVRARGLGELTLSMLQGREGRQAKELDRLMAWLERQARPDVVHLSSPLLLGIGAEIKRRHGVPVVCTLQDEDVWIDAMEEPWRGRCWSVMAEGAREVDAFIGVSRWFGERMRERLRIPPERLHVVPVGVDPGSEPGPRSAGTPPAIGFLARMSKGMGLGILAEAFLKLKKSGGPPGLRLRLSGGSTADDAEFLDGLRRDFAAQGVAGDVDFIDDFDQKHRRPFLESLSVLTVPAPHGVAFGTFVLEALAAGTPVVLPRLGSYPELVEATGGGILYEPNDASTLAATLAGFLADPARATELVRRGRAAVVQTFDQKTMAGRIRELYGTVTRKGTP